MQDLFVTDKDAFEVSVYYTREGGRLEIKNSSALKDEEKSSGKFKSISVKFTVPTWSQAQEIMRSSTTFANGRPHMDFGVFQVAMMKVLASGWDVKDDEGKEVPYSLERLGSLRPEIGRAIFEGLQEKLTEYGVYDTILIS